MKSILYSYGFHNISLIGSIFFFQIIFLCFWFLLHNFQPLYKFQQTKQQTISKPSKTSPGWILTGCNFNEVRTKTERGMKKKQRASKEIEGRQKKTQI